MKRLFRVAVLVAVTGVVLPVSGFAADKFSEARASIQRHMVEKGVPGMAVAVWKDGKILWEEGFGWADRENRVAASEHTMFCLASLSKSLTATGLMTLVQAGKIDLDHPVNDYLGDDKLRSAIADPRNATVRRVADHTSGLTPADRFFYGADAALMPSMDVMIRRYGLLVREPGRYEYSNMGYGVLGHAMARVSGKTYANFMREEVFLPLGMTHSSVDVGPELAKHQSVRYDYTGKPIPYYVSAVPASASIFSSAHDLARFGMFFLKDRLPDQRAILSDASIDRMTSDPVAVDADEQYGIGWEMVRKGGYQLVQHSGSTSGVHTIFILIPSENLGMVLLANIDGGVRASRGSLTVDILKTLLPKWRDAKAQSASAEEEAPFKPTPALTGTWQGTVSTYEGTLPIRLQIAPSGEVHTLIGENSRWRGRSSLQQPALLNDVAFKDGELTGTSLSQIETSDSSLHPHSSTLQLTLRDGVLSGTVTASSVYTGLWIYSFPYWAELKKVAADAAVTQRTQ
ncbi:serine hydrolase domain-containing protein [Steroidobacter sp.]|uniref:serine hydrolase domain-containing protein n=1 Tax=Steroidobacter sp. TaxID=1978227 RepID=UPI001A3F415E|nr:serine hydrolase domain-containing protein [Steroidobacter sp.]MBL8271111.1 beta-lactamase family protein [Steroidobacter sp.]